MTGHLRLVMAIALLSLSFMTSIDYCLSADEKILSLHHSTGRNVYNEGNVAGWIRDYNELNGTSYSIQQRAYPNSPYPWHNYPYDYWNLWINGECNSNDPNIECLQSMVLEYDVIIFKHCYPGSDILEDTGSPSVDSSRKSLENYKLQYRALRELMDSYPDTIFIIWTLPPRHRLATNPDNAARAKLFVAWVRNEFLTEDGRPHPNIFIFDFWGIVAEEDQNPDNGVANCLKYEYERSHTSSDSHPNSLANKVAGPLYAERIVAVINDFKKVQPKPDIKINGSDNYISVDSNQIVTMNLSMTAGDRQGQMADWWLAVWVNDLWYSYVYKNNEFQWVEGLFRLIEAPIINFGNVNIPIGVLLPGDYYFIMALDDNADNIPDATWYDFVHLVVE